MKIQASCHDRFPGITIGYSLITSSAYPAEAGLGDEPIALCTLRWARAVAMEEYELVAWHFPSSGRPIAMPVEEMREPDEGVFAGRFLLLPGRDLTLVLLDEHGQARSLAQLSLQPSTGPGDGEEEDSASWDVSVVWSEGVAVALQKTWFMYTVSTVRGLSLTDAQCGAFLQLGGLLAAPVGIADAVIFTKITGCAPGAESMEVSLHQERLPGGQISVSAHPDLQAALVQGNVDLGACWVLLPRLCPACGSPVHSEIARVATLWGWMHPGCVRAETRQEASDDAGAQAPGGGWSVTPSCQPALPGMQ
jgi:hypothetical protein